ncbi:MAG: acylphosphatase [Hyphomicrobiaceae bacterium]|nr:acylphosphatase [Hyphomicrobiaceae bacterium]
MTDRTVHVRITGRVQGVSYRAWTEDAAAELGLRGWVRNRRDGSVEAIFSGTDAAVADILARCKSGPPAARVDGVAVTERPPGNDLPAGFDFRPTAD